MKIFDLEIIESPPTHDSDDVHIKDKKGKNIGYAFRDKKEGSFHIMRCPRCHRENHAMAVSQGDCAWCGFSLNK